MRLFFSNVLCEFGCACEDDVVVFGPLLEVFCGVSFVVLVVCWCGEVPEAFVHGFEVHVVDLFPVDVVDCDFSSGKSCSSGFWVAG